MASAALSASLEDPATLQPADRERWAAWHGHAPIAASPFLHPAFAVAASRALPTTRVAVIRRGAEVVGFLPADVRGRAARSIAPALNDGDGIVLRPGIGLDLLALLRACGLRSYGYRHMPAVPSPFTPFHDDGGPTARVSVRDGYAAYAEGRRAAGHKVLPEAARKGRRLARALGPLRFELHDDHDRHADRLLAWKAAQVAAAGGTPPDETTTRSSAALLRALGEVPGDSGVESALSTLRAGDRLVAIAWSLRAGPLWVLALPTFDLALAPESPGLLLHASLLRAVADRDDVDEVDLGLDVNRLKGRLMTHEVPFAKGTAYTSAAMRLHRRLRTRARRAIRGA